MNKKRERGREKNKTGKEKPLFTINKHFIRVQSCGNTEKIP